MHSSPCFTILVQHIMSCTQLRPTNVFLKLKAGFVKSASHSKLGLNHANLETHLVKTPQTKQLVSRSRQSKTTWCLWTQAIDTEGEPELFWSEVGFLHLKVDQTLKYLGDDNTMSRRHVCKDKCVCPTFVVLAQFFLFLFFFLFWLHSKPHTWVRPVYQGATFILSILLTFFTLKKEQWTEGAAVFDALCYTDRYQS